MSSTSKHVNAYARWGCALIGGLLIGLGISGLVSASMLARGNEAWIREMNSLISIWIGLHPSDSVPPAQIPSDSYYAYANLQSFLAVLIFIGIAVSAVGFYSVHSSTKTVSPLPPTSPQPQIVGTTKTKRSS